MLCVACKVLDEATFNEWNQKYQDALTSVNQREKKVEKVSSLIETDLTLLGATVIEDRLQEGVPDALQDFSKVRRKSIISLFGNYNLTRRLLSEYGS